jgi:transcriptional regulator with XRE-family HTH domain
MDGQKLKLERAKAGLTLKQLAEKADLTYVQISNIETGRIKNPHWSSLVKLARALGLESDYFVGD